MNKRSKYLALVGLLALLFMPGISHAQWIKSAATVERAFFRARMVGEGQKMVMQYVPRPGVKYPLNTDASVRELQKIIGKAELSEITSLDIALFALSRNYDKTQTGEKWVVFALNHGANPSDVLSYAIRNGSQFADKSAARVLIEDYGLNPNAMTSDGEPILYDIAKKGDLTGGDLDLPGFDLNIPMNGEPLIFSLRYGGDFAKIFKRIKPWEITNNMQANPLHVAANSFKLSDVIPENFQIPAQYLNAQDMYGNTYYHYALQGKYRIENVEWLIKHGANPNIPNHFGDVPTRIISQRLTSLGGN